MDQMYLYFFLKACSLVFARLNLESGVGCGAVALPNADLFEAF